MIFKNCLNCGKKFAIKKQSEASRPNRNCCSRSCATTTLNNRRYVNLKQELTCKCCGKSFIAKYARERKKNFCTSKCATTWRNVNVEHSEKSKSSARNTAIKNFKGKKRSRLSVLKSANSIKGENHWNWQGGKSGWNKLMRSNIDFKTWRRKVFQRDDYRCVICGDRSGPGHNISLNADHIKPLALYPHLAYTVSNGRTLCVTCHRKTPTYGGKINCKRALAWGPVLRKECE